MLSSVGDNGYWAHDAQRKALKTLELSFSSFFNDSVLRYTILLYIAVVGHDFFPIHIKQINFSKNNGEILASKIQKEVRKRFKRWACYCLWFKVTFKVTLKWNCLLVDRDYLLEIETYFSTAILIICCDAISYSNYGVIWHLNYHFSD